MKGIPAWAWWAALVSAKPALSLGAAFTSPGCLEGANGAGVAHIWPTVAALGMLAGGWMLLVLSKMHLFRLTGWAFLVGASMCSTVPLARATDIRLPEAEWFLLAVAVALWSVPWWSAITSSDPRFKVAGALIAAVVLAGVFAPLAGPLSSGYVAVVAVVFFGCLALLIPTMARLQRREEATDET